MPITYDDVSYFNDSLRRLHELYSHGTREFLLSFVNNPMHSPYSTILACMSFAVFGINDWAPYASNLIIVLVVLFFIDFILDKTPWHWRLLCIIFTLTLPLMGYSVHEFRPDLAAGAMTGIGITLLLVPSLFPTLGRFQSVIAGVAFGLAFASKITLLPLTFIFMLAALLLASLRDMILKKEDVSIRQVITAWARCLVPALLVFLPFFAISWEHHVRYMYAVVFSAESAIWQVRGGLLKHVLYYLFGTAGKECLGQHFFILSFIIVGGLVIAHIKGKRDDFISMGLLVSGLVITYVIPTAFKIKSPFFGNTFYYTFLFTSIVSIKIVLGSLESRAARISQGVLISLTILGMVFFQFPGQTIARMSPEYKKSLVRIDQEIFTDILQLGFTQESRIFYTFAGFLDGYTLNYRLMKNGYFGQTILDLHKSDSLEAYSEFFDNVDFVVAGEFGTDYMHSWLPSGKVADSTLKLLKERKDFSQVKHYRTPNGKSYYLFKRI